MSDFGYFPAVTRFGQDDGTSDNRTQVTASGSANTKGSWTQLAASCPFNATGLILNTIVPLGSALIDIGIGGAGSEQIIIPNIATFTGSTGTNFFVSEVMPVMIPSGTRVAARIAGSSGSVSAYIKAQFVAFNGHLPLQTATDYGTDAANSRGTAVTTGSTGAKGSWAQMTASCEEITWLLWSFLGQNTLANSNWAFDLGVGGAGSEQVIIPDVYNTTNPVYTFCLPQLLLPVRIAKGSRIAVRAAGYQGASMVVYPNLIGFA